MNKLMVGALVAAGQVIAIAGGTSQSFALERITIADVGSGSANHWPAYGAMAQGYFKKAGIEPVYIPTPSSASVMQQLAAGSADMGSGGVIDQLRAIDKGAPVTFLRIEAGPAPYEVYAKPGIDKFSQLKGKIVMLGGAKDITRLYFERMASPNGLKPGSYDMVYAGATSARLAALSSGSIAATILMPPFSFKAQAAGFSRLPAPADFSKGLPFTGYSVSTAWAKSHKAVIAKFLDAYSKGVKWFYNPANKQQAIDILVKTLKVPKDEAAKAYDLYVSLKVFTRNGSVAKSGLEGMLKMMKAQGDISGSAGLSRFYDPKIFESAK